MATKTILVVEDDKDIRRNLKALLESEGYLVEVAENGQIAIDFLAQATDLPNLIILDLMMPVMDGFEFREKQDQIARIASIPVAIMTADGHVEEKKFRTGAAAALRKPADIEDILATVKQLAG
ncbi:MAG: response regulator [Pseudobdellovibrionaceae bacterium]